jgi:hypothetical protein
VSFWSAIIDHLTGGRISKAEALSKRYAGALRNSIQAAQQGGRGWSGMHTNRDEDAANKESVAALPDVLQRSQDLDINNPDIHGFHRTRTAQIMGAHVRFRANPKADEVDLDADALRKLCAQIDRLRALHSTTGGFDSTGHRRSEGKQQERAQLTAFIHGSCLIHRVWRPEQPICPLSLELIPGVRISTPFQRAGDPKLSYGIEYEDTLRTRVVAYHVRRVSETRGDSFVPSYVWDRLPVEDCSLLELAEPAGMDRALPLSTCVVRMSRNRGEMIESTVESARAQATNYATRECADGADPYAIAADDRAEDALGSGEFETMAGGAVRMLYLGKGEKVNWNAAKLPDPDFVGFMDVTDARISRGLVSSLSRFTRKVNSSWAGGRLEDQQDDPIIDQYRDALISAWQRVNEWFVEALWIVDAVAMPGYSTDAAHLWSVCRAEFPPKLHINPVDTVQARERSLMQRSMAPQQACEQDGHTYRDQLILWAEAAKEQDEIEKEYGLEPGRLDVLISGKSISTAAGEDIAAPAATTELAPGQSPPTLKIAAHAARRGETNQGGA